MALLSSILSMCTCTCTRTHTRVHTLSHTFNSFINTVHAAQWPTWNVVKWISTELPKYHHNLEHLLFLKEICTHRTNHHLSQLPVWGKSFSRTDFLAFGHVIHGVRESVDSVSDVIHLAQVHPVHCTWLNILLYVNNSWLSSVTVHV